MAKKIAIVGGGISGLTAGIYALNAGFTVDIFEKNGVVGGECTGWDRDGYHIDNCVHWLMGTKPGSELNKIWKETGVLTDGVEIIHTDKMYTSVLGNDSLSLWKDIKRTEAEMKALSPEDETEIKRLLRHCSMAKNIEIPALKPMESMGLFDLLKLGIKSSNAIALFKEYKNVDTNDLMERFKHPLIRCSISDFCTKESLGYSFPIAYGNFTGGDGGIPRGGSLAMALRMGKRFEELGGKIHLGSSVEKINIHSGKASGLLLEHGERVPADYVVCSCDPDYTFNHLLEPTYMDAVFREVYSNRGDYPVYGMFQAAYSVDSDMDPLGGEVIFDSSELRFEEWVSDRITVKIYSYEPNFAPQGKQVLQVLFGMKEVGYEYWSALYNDKEKYRIRKFELAEKIMGFIAKRIPEYSGKMGILDVWTPMTYKRYCNAFKGYNQAFTITKKSMKNPYPSPFVNGIDNVILSGQWLSPPGGLPGAAIQGKFAVMRLLKKEGGKREI